ncbi:MAG: SDR family oxidoreductase [Saprospiraceae bacterium]|nr:SDR family oxidoreductase [Saprospiraceae bacterium]
MERTKRAVITGATKGIGRAITEAMVESGYDVAICARTQADLDTFAGTLRALRKGCQVLTLNTDVRDKQELKQFADRISAEWDTVDVLVNNAGLFVPGEILKEPDLTLEMMMEVNVYSAYYLTRHLLPLLQGGSHGHIFNMCSIASLKAYPGGGSYTIAKFALRGMSMVLREELKQQNIKVTTVIPGATWTDSWKGAGFPEERLMPAADIAEAVMSALRMSPGSVVEEILIRPQLGDL